MRVPSLLLCTLLFPAAAYSQTNGTFYNPPDPSDVQNFARNPVYKIGDTLQVRWFTQFENISLVLWQDESPDFEYLLPDVPNPNNYDWIISTNFNINNRSLQHPHVFYLSVYNFGSTTDYFDSHYINLTNPSSSTKSVASKTSSATSTPTLSLSRPAPVAATSTTAASSDDDSASGGLSSSTKVGLGIGIGVGIPLLVIVGALIGWRLAANKRKRSAASPPQTHVPLMSSDAPRTPPLGPLGQGAAYHQQQDAYQRPAPIEKPGDAYNGFYAPAHELPDRQPAGPELPDSQRRVYHELPDEAAGGR